MNNKTKVTFYIDTSLLQRLKIKAIKEGKSFSKKIEEYIREGLKGGEK